MDDVVAETETTRGHGDLYLESIPLEARRRAGQVYTPRGLVDFVLDQTGYTAAEEIDAKRILDPACGAGAFLEVAVIRLAQRLNAQGIALASLRGRSQFLRAVEACIYGVDIDPMACALARDAVRRRVSQIVAGTVPPSFFARNVLRADYLFAPSLKGANLRGRNAKFHYIVGNPPYVSTGRLSAEYKLRLRRAFTTARGRVDLYTAFIERSLRFLGPAGKFSFITPNKFLISVTGTPLRALLVKSGAVKSIANFRSHQVFDGAATVPCVMTFERGSTVETVDVFDCDIDASPARRPAVLKASCVPASRLGAPPWRLDSGDIGDLVSKINGAHAKLGNFASRVSAGLATGLDGVFVVPRRSPLALENALRRPAIRGRDLSRHQLVDPELDLIIPYEYDREGHAKLVRLKDYPQTYAYLRGHRDRLEKRHCHRVWRKAWYDFHDPVSMDITRTAKILVPDVANSNRFVFDGGAYCPLHSAYYIVPKNIDPYYLTAILNSKPIEFLVRVLAPIVKDGFSRYRKQFLMPLPVPSPSPADLVAIVEAARRGDVVSADILSSDLFGLSHRELKTLDEFLDAARRHPRMSTD